MNGTEYVVYVDVFFLINFIMDYLIISITSIIRKNKTKTLRKISGAAFGALYSVIIIKPLINHLLHITLMNIVVAAVMVLISFGINGFITYLKNVALLFGISFTLSGIINYLYYSTIAGKYIRNVICGNSNKIINARKFIVISFMTYILLNIAIKVILKLKKDLLLYYDIKITYHGKSVVARALFDTGNSLWEPISEKMVHIAEYALLKPLLEGDESAKENICVIPFHSVGKDNGVMYGIRMDEMVVIVEGKPEFLFNPIIGIYMGNISKHGKYSVILNRDTFDEIKNNVKENNN